MLRKFLNRLLRKEDAGSTLGKTKGPYVSEFADFMDQFLKEHPEVARDRRVGMAIFWNRKVDFAAQAQSEKDRVPEDGYGFSLSVWTRNKQRLSPTEEGDDRASSSPPKPG